MRRSYFQSPKKAFLLKGGIIFCVAIIAGIFFGQYELSKNKGVIEDINAFGALGKQFAIYGNLAGSIRRGPIYPVFIGLEYKIFGENPSALIFSQSCLLGLLGLLSFLISYSIFKSIRTAFLTGICTVLFPALLWYVDRLYVELLFSILVLLMIWYAYKALSHSTWWNLTLFGIITGIAALCKAVVLLFPFFLACIVFALFVFKVRPFNFLNRIYLIRFFIFPTIVMLITITPWTIRNHIVSGTWTLVSSNIGVEFYRGNVYAEQNSFLLQKSNPVLWDIAMENEKQILSQNGIDAPLLENVIQSPIYDSRLDRIFNPLMTKYIYENPFQFGLKIIKQIPAFWTLGVSKTNSMAITFMALCTLFIFFKGFQLLKEKTIFGYVVLIFIVYSTLTYAALLSWARYSVPTYPPMLIVCCYWATQWIVSIKRRQIK